jgi:hypothetical protein
MGHYWSNRQDSNLRAPVPKTGEINHSSTTRCCGTGRNRTYIAGSSIQCLDQLGNCSVLVDRFDLLFIPVLFGRNTELGISISINLCASPRIRTLNNWFGSSRVTITLETQLKCTGRCFYINFGDCF